MFDSFSTWHREWRMALREFAIKLYYLRAHPSKLHAYINAILARRSKNITLATSRPNLPFWAREGPPRYATTSELFHLFMSRQRTVEWSRKYAPKRELARDAMSVLVWPDDAIFPMPDFMDLASTIELALFSCITSSPVRELFKQSVARRREQKIIRT
jgi:hypothetical protein